MNEDGHLQAPLDPAEMVLEGVSTLFEALGRALVCLDHDFKIVHASSGLGALAGAGEPTTAVGQSIDEVLGAELFGAAGSIRAALLGGEKREGWGATLQLGDSRPRLVSVTAAPITHTPGSLCDPRVSFVVVLRAAEEDQRTGVAAPTVFSGLLARSAAMLKIFQLVEHLAESDATVLISGESGTGKELVARAVHVHSGRGRGPFLPVNCGALPQDLLESELFGHARGAFTGAVRDRAGRFELADGGTIFLDEIGELPLHLQVKLLRVLQEKTFERVGESETRSTNTRIVAATNRDLRRAVIDGEFRDDLYYRLRVVPIEIPPLRERREDIEPLANHLLRRVGRRHDRALRLGNDAMRAILRYGWPGNVRELENALEYAMAVVTGQTIHVQDLPVEVADTSGGFDPIRRHPPAAPGTVAQSAAEARRPEADLAAAPAAVSAAEQDRIRAALDAHRWKRAEAAAALGMSRTTLWRRMRELGLGA